MRALWEGSISFGLVSLPVSMYPATQPTGYVFRLMHEKCAAPVNYERRCPHCGAIAPWAEIVRGFEYENGKFVMLKDEDLERIPLKTTKTIDIVDFVDARDIDPIYVDKTYYLVPQRGGEKAYGLLAEALDLTRKTAVGKVVVREKEHLAAVRFKSGALLLETLFYPDEVRPPEFWEALRQKPRLGETEVRLAVELVDALSSKWDPHKYVDEYRQALRQLIRAKMAGQQLQPPVSGVETGRSLEDALKASIEAVKKKREPI